MSKKHRKTNIYLMIGAIMEKLVELLNEYEKERKSGFTWRSIDNYDNCVYGVDCDGETEITMYSDLYSKQYGFIKWLVENNKIDFDKLKPLTGVTEIMLATNCPNRIEVKRRYRLYEQLIMLLSISNTPIEDLISYLK